MAFLSSTLQKPR